MEHDERSDNVYPLVALKHPKVCSAATNHEMKPVMLGSFPRRMPANVVDKFCEIVSDVRIRERVVHRSARTKADECAQIFYRYFFEKCVFDVSSQIPRNGRMENFVSIFPFKVWKTLGNFTPPIANRLVFDDGFQRKIVKFCERHFKVNDFDSHEIFELFLFNVHLFKEKFFTSQSIEQLNNLVHSLNDEKWDHSSEIFINDWLERYPRFNEAGIKRHINFEKAFAICTGRVFTPKKRQYYRFLPEINVYELFSLLDYSFYEISKAHYMRLLKKYLFFFGHALDSQVDHPVLFVDEILFECMKCYCSYKYLPLSNDISLQSPFIFKIFWFLALVHNQGLSFPTFLHHRMGDVESLKKIQSYVENIPNIESAWVNYLEPGWFHNFSIPVVTHDCMYEIRFAETYQIFVDLAETIMKASTLSIEVGTIAVYNALSGVEYTLNMPKQKSEILKFVRQHYWHRDAGANSFLFVGREKLYRNLGDVDEKLFDGLE